VLPMPLDATLTPPTAQHPQRAATARQKNPLNKRILLHWATPSKAPSLPYKEGVAGSIGHRPL
jgi:hypothetical protein